MGGMDKKSLSFRYQGKFIPLFLKELLMGFCLGAANIIPGVSGGTFLLVFNIYERVFAILNRINKTFIFQAVGLGVRFIRYLGQKGSTRAIAAFLEQNDFAFLCKLITGAAAAIFGLSSLMTYLLVQHFSLTYAFFFGLILVSILIPAKMLRTLRVYLVLFVFLGAAMTMAVYMQVNPYDKVKQKSDYYRIQYELEKMDNTLDDAKNNPVLSSGRYTVQEYLYAGLCGAISISAMVLPGISGSLVLILMGAYFDVLSAISAVKYFHLDTMVFLGSFTLGIVFGGLLFARLVNYVLTRYYDATMAFLLGLMAGSLWALWPFKQVIVVKQQYVKQDGAVTIVENVPVYTNANILPAADGQLLWAVGLFFVGCGIMYWFCCTRARVRKISRSQG
jgi:putative membrane protein